MMGSTKEPLSPKNLFPYYSIALVGNNWNVMFLRKIVVKRWRNPALDNRYLSCIHNKWHFISHITTFVINNNVIMVSHVKHSFSSLFSIIFLTIKHLMWCIWCGIKNSAWWLLYKRFYKDYWSKQLHLSIRIRCASYLAREENHRTTSICAFELYAITLGE